MTISVYMTARDQDEAQKLARMLVEKKLVACANLFPMRSVYRWHEKVQEEYEFVIIAKTQAKLFDQVKEAVREMHSYDVPCIVALPHVDVDKPYADWIREETE